MFLLLHCVIVCTLTVKSRLCTESYSGLYMSDLRDMTERGRKQMMEQMNE